MSNQDVITFLNEHLGALPHEEYGIINLLPFSVKSDQTDALRLQVSQAIVGLLETAGFLRQHTPESAAEPGRDVQVTCRLCSATFMHLLVGDGGVANVPAAMVITQLGQLSPECPHDRVTVDDQRLKIEEAVRGLH